MSEDMQWKARAGIVFLAPVVVLVGFLMHPLVNETSASDIAEEVVGSTSLWLWSHLVLGVSLPLTVLAIFSIRLYLRGKGEHRWSFYAVPLVTVGAGLLGLLTGLEGIGAWTAVELGSDVAGVEAFIDQAMDVANPLYGIGGVLFSLGFIAIALSVAKSGAFSRTAVWVIGGAVALLVVGSFVPLPGFGYVVGVAAVVFGGMVGAAIWRDHVRPTVPVEATM